MSHQVITRMAYNAKTKQIETWQHSMYGKRNPAVHR